mgnify:CR=1 FL=1
MEAQQILSELKLQEKTLRSDLIEMEKVFNQKKEQYLKITGAIEALNLVEGVEEDEDEDLED